MNNTYVFYGPESGSRQEAVQSIVAGQKSRHGDGLEIQKIFLSEDDFQSRLSDLSNGALFATHTLALFQNAELIKKAQDIAALKQFLSSGPGDTTLVFVSEETRLEKKFLDLFPKENRKIFYEMFENQKSGWVVQYLRKRNATIRPEALELFLTMAGTNTLEMQQELDKMLLMLEPENGGATITEELIETYMFHSREESVYRLFDAYVSRDFSRGLDITHKILGAKSNEETSLLIRMSYILRNLLSLSSIRDERRIEDRDFLSMGIRGKMNQGAYRTALGTMNTSMIRAHVSASAHFEMELRTQKGLIHQHIIVLWLYTLFQKHVPDFAKSGDINLFDPPHPVFA